MSQRNWVAANAAYTMGVIVRGLVLGLALTAAVATLWAWSESARVFRYEAF